MATNVPWFDNSPGAYLGPASPNVPGKVGPWGQIVFSAKDGANKTNTWVFTGKVTGRHGTKIDFKPRLGKKGSTGTNLQLRQTEIEARLNILTPDDLNRFSQMIQVFRRFRNANTAIGVAYPGLAILGVTHLFYTEGDVPNDPPKGQAAVFVLRFREWIPADDAAAASVTPNVGSDSQVPDYIAHPQPFPRSTPQVAVPNPPADSAGDQYGFALYGGAF